MEKAGMYVRLFFKENTTGSVRCGRGERKDTDGIKAEGVYGMEMEMPDSATFISGDICFFCGGASWIWHLLSVSE